MSDVNLPCELCDGYCESVAECRENIERRRDQELYELDMELNWGN